MSVSRLTTLPFALEQRLQDAVVVFRQLNALSLIRQARIGHVEHGAAVLERGRRRGKVIRAAQNGLDLRQQHVQVKGLAMKSSPPMFIAMTCS